MVVRPMAAPNAAYRCLRAFVPLLTPRLVVVCQVLAANPDNHPRIRVQLSYMLHGHLTIAKPGTQLSEPCLI